MISGDRAIEIEKQLAQLLGGEVDELRDYVRGSRALVVRLDGQNKVLGVGGEYLDRKEVDELLAAAGWDSSGRGLLNWVWGSEQPADIPTLL